MADSESSSCEVLFAFYEKSKATLAMKSVKFGFARTNMISEVAINEGMSLFVSVLYGHALATLMLLPFTYILDGYV